MQEKYFGVVGDPGGQFHRICRVLNGNIYLNESKPLPQDLLEKHNFEPGVNEEEAIASILDEIDRSESKFGRSNVSRMELEPRKVYPRIARPLPTGYKRGNIVSGLQEKYHRNMLFFSRQLESLCSMLDDIFYVIYPDEKNYNVYGSRLREFLLLACTEVESQLKGVLNSNNYSSLKWNLNMIDYKKIENATRISSYGVKILGYDSIKELEPFSIWNSSECAGLSWYQAYNLVKHDREKNFDQANLRNCIEAISARFLMGFVQYGNAWLDKSDKIKRCFFVSKFPEWRINECYHGIHDVSNSKVTECFYDFN